MTGSELFPAAIQNVELEWDAGNLGHCRAHGLEPEDVRQVFANTPTVFGDPAHSHAEVRYRAIGLTDAGRYAFVVFTLRAREGATLVRPISARYMHRREIESYEDALAAPRQ